MQRTQIYLESAQKSRLAALARRQNRPVAELIRELIDRYLNELGDSSPADDPLFDLVGASGDIETDAKVAGSHHQFLAISPHGKRRRR